jgi:zinc transporter ZupT
MTPVLFASLTIISTLAGGLFALKNKDRLHRILGFAAGVLLGLVAFGLLPEIFEHVEESGVSATIPMLALVAGFLVFHVLEKTVLVHPAQEDEFGTHDHHHPSVGKASAAALVVHSFLDGVGIGLAFQVNTGVGIAVTIAVLAHDFTDGINTVSLMLLHKNTPKQAVFFLLMDAVAPILGALSTLFFQVSDAGLLFYLGAFAGFLLYICASQILPEAHSKHSSYKTVLLTVVGVALMFVVSQYMHAAH